MTTQTKQPLLVVRPLRQYEMEMPGFTQTCTAWSWKGSAMLLGLVIWVCAVWVVFR